MTPARAHSLSPSLMITPSLSHSLSLPLWDQSVRFMSLYFDSRAFKYAFPVRGLSVRDTIDALRRSRTEPISVSRQMVHDFKFQVPVYIKIASLGNSNSNNNKRNQSPNPQSTVFGLPSTVSLDLVALGLRLTGTGTGMPCSLTPSVTGQIAGAH